MERRPDGLGLWDEWLDSSLAYLRRAQLLRILHPTLWCNSSSEALIHRADLDAWVAGEPPVVRHYDHCASLAGSASILSAPANPAAVCLAGNARAACDAGPPTAAAAAACRQHAGCSFRSEAQTQARGGASDRGGRCGGWDGSNPAIGSGRRPSASTSATTAAVASCSSPSSAAPCCSSSSSSPAAPAAADAPTDLVRLRLFSLNDYLGLASHPEVAAAAALAASKVGLGPRSSALVAGYTHSHRQLEEGLAALKGTEDCLLFPTGFAANLASITTLAAAAPAGGGGGSGGGGVAIFSDELNHASIIDGARLAARGAGGDGGGARLYVYRHNDLDHLEELLASCPAGWRRLVVTDSLFSMDGDFADLRRLAALKRRHPFLLGVDEAHATLVCGHGGGGAAEACGVADQVDLHIGTLSKAFGSLGGFVACSAQLKQLLLNRGRPFVYSTSLPVPVVEAAAAALRVSQRESWRRAHVWSLVGRLGAGLGVPALSPVVPLVVGPEGPTLALSSRLLAEGMHVPAIRPPTVPPGTCRLRVSLSAAHTTADVDELIRVVRQAAVPLARLSHLLDPRATLPGHAGGGDGCGGDGCIGGGGVAAARSRL